jgi:electron transfer flavoprotein alpha subunit
LIGRASQGGISDVNSPVLVFAEQSNGRLAEVSLELVGKGRELADRLGAPLGAVLAGHDVAALADELIACGCDDVYLVQDLALRQYRTLPYQRAVCDVIREAGPQVVLYGASPVGRDLAPRIASELRAGLTADCTDLQIGDHSDSRGEYKDLLLQIRPAFGGNIIATIVCPESRPQMATVREGVMRMPTSDRSRRGRVRRMKAELSDALMAAEVLRRETREKKVNLKAANIIVSGGAGVGSKENFRLIYDLAHVLGAAVGASRSAVDQGFIGHDHQVGQTGTTVRPKLYIACGISGAVQHRAGMQESAKIVAINTDPDAPIFDIAHYAIVGDLNRVIPMMIKAYKEKV